MSSPTVLVSSEAQFQLIEAAVEAFNCRDLDRWMDFYAEDAVHFQPNRARPLCGKGEIREDYRLSTWIPFPDFHFELQRLFGQAPWVCVQGVFSGTHEGPLLVSSGTSIPATHNSIRIPLCLVVKMEAGRAVEVHEYNDQLGFLSQLGLIL